MDNRKDVPYIVFEGAEAKNERLTKRLIIIIAILIFMLFATNMVWLYAWNSYDMVSYGQDGEGFNNLNTGEQGDVINEPTIENESEEK